MTQTQTNGIRRLFAEIGDRQARMIMAILVLACCALVWWVSVITGVPQDLNVSGSLLLQAHPVWAVFIAAVCLFVCLFISGWLAKFAYEESGLFVATFALMVIAGRAGAMRYVLFSAPYPGTFLLMAFELLLLYAWVALAWYVLRLVVPLSVHDSIGNGVSVMLVQAVVMAACITFLAMSDLPGQAIMAVAVGALAGSMVAHLTFPVENDIWYWLGPLLVGLVGYLMAWQNPAGLQIGFPQGALGALARPTPLAYASAGPAGAILGLWTARPWQEPKEENK
ncbi:MAG TPA: hypothetical protein VMD30_09895 [Tepidisphaeraceae bacterium]|nr:hypothetical protein [Tepidisphaeraceae bacterium]